jgi:hypothetical protein
MPGEFTAIGLGRIPKGDYRRRDRTLRKILRR